MSKVNVGIIGCGNISDIYLKNLTSHTPEITVAACADLNMAKAVEKSEKYGVSALSVDQLLADPGVEVILNLTNPDSHAIVNQSALLSGKSVYTEKPLSVSLEDAERTLKLAESMGLLVGCAPDTFLGAGLQTCRNLIDNGWIGRPVAATAFMMCHGHESWHPNPEFYYKPGGGPMYDMGPYYLTALVSLLGPVARVTGSAQVTYPQRTISSQPFFGKTIEVEVPTHVTGLLEFQSGVSAAIVMSFDVWHSQLPRIEIYGSEGTLIVPDPNTFAGPVYLRRSYHDDWSSVPLTHVYSENCRGIGVADIARALRAGSKHRANGQMACHVLEIMHSIHVASVEGRHQVIRNTCERPEALTMSSEPGFWRA